VRSLLLSGVGAVAGTAVLALVVTTATGSETETAPLPGAVVAAAPAASTPGAPAQEADDRLPFDGWGDGYPSHAVTARIPSLKVHESPDGPVAHELAQVRPSGAPLTLRLLDVEEAWLQVDLPVRPNGSTGWVRRDHVDVTAVRYRVDVSLSQHELRVYDLGELMTTYPVGVGTEAAPTPGGTFSITELVQPTNADGMYGPYAFGLSGFSEVLTEFAGGEAAIGIHGTNDPASIGSDASHGCIRMHNEDVSELAELLPLGTPVRILA
jgi:lipoprotein-anchoring transpeptidase ErfK/SrfK